MRKILVYIPIFTVAFFLLLLLPGCGRSGGVSGTWDLVTEEGVIPREADHIVRELSRVNTPLEKAVYHFKMGEVYNSAEDSYKAMEEFLEAEKWSMDIKNDFLKGQIYWYKGKLYYDRLDYTNALNMFTLASEYYTNCGKREELMYTYEQVASIHSRTRNFEEAIFYYNRAKAIALELRDRDSSGNGGTLYNKLILNFSTAISGVYFSQLSSSREALEQLHQAYLTYNNGRENEEDYLLLSCIYLDAGKIDKSREYVNKYTGRGKRLTGEELAGLLSHQSSIEKRAGNFRKALEYRERYDSVMDSLNLMERNSSMRELEQKYWQKELQLENTGIKTRNRYITIIYSLLLLITGGVAYMVITAYNRRIKQKNSQIEEYMAMVDNLGNIVSDAESSRSNLLGQLDVHIEKEKRLKELLENRFAEVRELVRTYYEFGDSKKLHKKVDDLLKLQLSGDNFSTIEEVVNAKNNNAVKKVREQFPHLKEDNIKLLNLIYAGFSAQEISVILNDTPQNIYVRKSRLKKSIASLIDSDPEMNFS